MENTNSEFDQWMQTNREARAFALFREGKPIPFGLMSQLIPKALFKDPFINFICHYPGGIGFKMRDMYYRGRLKSCGMGVLLDQGVRIDDPARISIGDYVWIDRNVNLQAGWGSITIGRRVHVAENVLISGCGHVTIEDYAAVARGVSIYSHSEAIVNGKRMSGPMIPESQKGMKTAPIKIGRDAVVSVNALILPGVTIGEGAIVGANSMVNRDVKDWDIVFGSPAKPIAKRPKVTVEDC